MKYALIAFISLGMVLALHHAADMNIPLLHMAGVARSITLTVQR